MGLPADQAPCRAFRKQDLLSLGCTAVPVTSRSSEAGKSSEGHHTFREELSREELGQQRPRGKGRAPQKGESGSLPSVSRARGPSRAGAQDSDWDGRLKTLAGSSSLPASKEPPNLHRALARPGLCGAVVKLPSLGYC